MLSVISPCCKSIFLSEMINVNLSVKIVGYAGASDTECTETDNVTPIHHTRVNAGFLVLCTLCTLTIKARPCHYSMSAVRT